MKSQLLRSCPTCSTPVSGANLGLRDFSWLNEYLPGKIGGMDIDCLIDQEKTGRCLVLEFKQKSASLSLGSRITFKGLHRKGFDIWAVWDVGGGYVEVAEFTWRMGAKEKMSKEELGKRVAEWWNEGLSTSP